MHLSMNASRAYQWVPVVVVPALARLVYEYENHMIRERERAINDKLKR